MDQSVDIAEPDVLALRPELQEHVETGDAGGPPAGRDDLHVGEFLARDPERIHRRRADHDGSAVLIIVKDRDVHLLAAQPLDDEAVRRLDVLEIDRPEGGLQRRHDLRKLHGIALVHLDVETVDIGELLEEHRLALHHRFRRERPDIAQTQHRGAVGHDPDHVGPAGIARGIGRLGLDLEAGLGHARRIGARQVPLVGQRLGRTYLKLSGLRVLMIVERREPRAFLAAVVHRAFPLSWFAPCGLVPRVDRQALSGPFSRNSPRMSRAASGMFVPGPKIALTPAFLRKA